MRNNLHIYIYIELEADLKKILSESLDLLTQAILQPIMAQYPTAQIKDLFDMEFYSHLIGTLEMYDNTIGIHTLFLLCLVQLFLISREIKSPLQKYLDSIHNLTPPQQESIKAVLHPVRDKVALVLEEEECEEDEDAHEEHDDAMDVGEGGDEAEPEEV